MNSPNDDVREDFENSLFYFIEAVKILAVDSESQCQKMGNFNTPWEIQHDVMDFGRALINTTSSHLSQVQREKLEELVRALHGLPDEAISSGNLSMTTHAGCIEVMKHAAWNPLRQEAAELLEIFDTAIQRNATYFR